MTSSIPTPASNLLSNQSNNDNERPLQQQGRMNMMPNESAPLFWSPPSVPLTQPYPYATTTSSAHHQQRMMHSSDDILHRASWGAIDLSQEFLRQSRRSSTGNGNNNNSSTSTSTSNMLAAMAAQPSTRKSSWAEMDLSHILGTATRRGSWLFDMPEEGSPSFFFDRPNTSESSLLTASAKTASTSLMTVESSE